jgi:hypothetical protein
MNVTENAESFFPFSQIHPLELRTVCNEEYSFEHSVEHSFEHLFEHSFEHSVEHPVEHLVEHWSNIFQFHIIGRNVLEEKSAIKMIKN